MGTQIPSWDLTSDHRRDRSVRLLPEKNSFACDHGIVIRFGERRIHGGVPPNPGWNSDRSGVLHGIVFARAVARQKISQFESERLEADLRLTR